MTKVAQDIIHSMQQAVQHSAGEKNGTRQRVLRVSDQVDVKAIRENLGISQHEFAVRYGFNLSSLRNWEQGRRFPDGPARTLLKVIEKNPEAVETALAV